MSIFDVLTMIGGLCLFLYGMDIMGKALERSAGSRLRTVLSRLTTNKITGLLTGVAVTAVIQSSSATTVMVVGFVNSSLMTLRQAIGVIMGANIGTTVTAWILSLGGISSDNLILSLLKPMSFTPVLALVGIILYMFCENGKKRDFGAIFLGFAVLMFGMDIMSDAVSGLADVPGFKNLFLLFSNPILGVAVGAILTAIIQSSSAAVGILQAFAATGQVTYGTALPIVMGQNIGTCITAIISCIGTGKNARRTALVHLLFNVMGTAICLMVFWVIKEMAEPAFFSESASLAGIAAAHSAFNIICTAILFPMSGILERTAMTLIPDTKTGEEKVELDEHLLAIPSVALERCHNLAVDMFDVSIETLNGGIKAFGDYSETLSSDVSEGEEKTDHYEDILGTYLVKLSSKKLSSADSAEAAKLLRMIGDFERISDHGVNLLKSAEELLEKEIKFTDDAIKELGVIFDATLEILYTTRRAFVENDIAAANSVEPLEQVIDELRENLRVRHIERLQQGESTIDAGFVWSDILTNIGRASDHCSNVAGCVIDMASDNLNLHETLRALKNNDNNFKEKYVEYKERFALS